MDDACVTFRDGTVASLPVLQCLWDIEARGGTFVPVENGGFLVRPQDLLTYTERMFLLAHRDEARRLIRYQADDSHLRLPQ
jgi:hypothetical protein